MKICSCQAGSGNVPTQMPTTIKPTTAMIGHGEPIRVPAGREQIDAECELTVVVGATASQVPVDKAVRAADLVLP